MKRLGFRSPFLSNVGERTGSENPTVSYCKTLWASLKDDIADTDRHENRQMFLTTVNKTDDQLILQSGDLRPPKKTGRHRKAKRVGQTKNKLNNEYSK